MRFGSRWAITLFSLASILTGETATIQTPIRLFIRIVAAITGSSLIQPSDLQFLGYQFFPLTGADLTDGPGNMGARMVGGQLRFFMNENYNGNINPPLAEFNDTGVYSLTRTPASTATLYCRWGDIYGGRRITWYNSGHPLAGQNRGVTGNSMLPGDFQFNDGMNTLFITYYVSYNSGGPLETDNASLMSWVPPSTCIPGGGTTAGAWKVTATGSNGAQFMGWRSTMFVRNMPDGKLGMQGSSRSITNQIPHGPEAFGGLDFPLASTPGGYNAPVLTTPDRWLAYYPTRILYDGTVVGILKKFHWTPFISPMTYTLEPFWKADYDDHRTDPASGILSSASADADGYYGGVWFDGSSSGPNGRRGALFPGNMVISASGANHAANCNTVAGEWYRNAGQISWAGSSTPGVFTDGEQLIGTSGAQATSTDWNASLNQGGATQSDIPPQQQSRSWAIGETVTGQSSKKSVVVTAFHRHDHCFHDCTFNGGAATGPVSTAGAPTLVIYDPNSLTLNNPLDFATLPDALINMTTQYPGFTASPQNSPANSKSHQVKMGHWDDTRNNLYVMVPDSEMNGGAFNWPRVAVFRISDGPSPLPLLVLLASASLYTGRRWRLQRAARMAVA